MAKVELFNKELQQTANIFKALGHPARLAILQYIGESKVCITGDISNELPLSRTTISQHLAELKDIGIIHGEIEGVKTNYCLNTAIIEKITETLNHFLNDIHCCGKDQTC